MTITHQDIIDRIEALGVEHSVAYRAEKARIAKERASVQELCGGLGHFFKKHKSDWSFMDGRGCVFCGADEPKNAAA